MNKVLALFLVIWCGNLVSFALGLSVLLIADLLEVNRRRNRRQ